MSSPLQPESTLLHFRLVERLSDGLTGQVWKAQDTQDERSVAIKVLGSGDVRTNRAELVRALSAYVGVEDPHLAAIREIAHSGPLTLVVRDFAEGTTLAALAGRKPLERSRFLQVAIQLAKGLRALHDRRLVHGNLRADNAILEQRTGVLRLSGHGLAKSHSRNPRGEGVAALSHLEIREVAHLSPEQIRGGADDIASDMFAAGVILFLLATGRYPFEGTTSSEVMTKILDVQPPNPTRINPAVTSSIVSILGRCLHKDPSKRYGSAAALLQDLRKEAGVADMENPESAKLGGDSSSREAVLLFADLGEAQRSDETERGRHGAVLQQIVGEAVYLYDGTVDDPFGDSVVAEFPDVPRALSAASKAQEDLVERGATEEPTDFRIMIHVDAVARESSNLEGAGVDVVRGAAAQIAERGVFASEKALARTAHVPTDKPALAFSGQRFFRMANGDTRTVVTKSDPTVMAAGGAPRRLRLGRGAMIGLAAGALVVLAIALFFLFRGDGEPAAEDVVEAVPVAPAPAAVRRVVIAPFDVTTSDDAIALESAVVQRLVTHLIASVDGLTLAEGFDTSLPILSATLRHDENGSVALIGEFRSGGEDVESPPFSLDDSVMTARRMSEWYLERLGMRPSQGFEDAPPEALGGLARAIRERERHGTINAAALAAIRDSVAAAPDFAALRIYELEVYESLGDRAGAVEAAAAVARLRPQNVEVHRKLSRWYQQEGRPIDAVFHARLILIHEPGDIEALRTIGRYALSVNDAAMFNQVLESLKKVPRGETILHPPDLLLATGRIDQAAKAFYDIETQMPDNTALALKIGRIAVLRHSMPIAEIELEKLEKGGDEFGTEVLRAYMAASKRDVASAQRHLSRARALATYSDEIETYTAEIWGILGSESEILKSIEAAIARGEPTLSHIFTNPLFRFLASESEYRVLRSRAEKQASELRALLARVTL